MMAGEGMDNTVALLLADGFEEIEAVAPADVLRRAGLDVTLLAVGDDLRVTGSHGLVLVADALLAGWGGRPGTVVLPGGMPGAERLGASAEARELTRGVAAAGGVAGAICAAPAFTVGPWGLADGKRVACYPGFESRLPATVEHAKDEAVVIDNKLVTARGPGAALPFAYALAEILRGADVAGRLRAEMQFRI